MKIKNEEDTTPPTHPPYTKTEAKKKFVEKAKL